MLQFFQKMTALASSGFFASLMFMGAISVPNEAVAQGNCTGTTFACATWSGSAWNIVKGSQAITYFDQSRFTFNNAGTAYPMTSDQSIEQATSPPIYVTVTRNPSTAKQGGFYLAPSSAFVWNAARNGYNLRGYSEDVVFRVEAKVSNASFQTVTGSGATQLPLSAAVDEAWNTGSGARGKSKNVNLTIRLTAVLYGPLSGSINVPTTQIFTMYGPTGASGTIGNEMGAVYFQGEPAIYIDPPKPSTCDAYTGGDKTFNLNRITIDQIAASGSVSSESNTQTVTLNCPAGITLKMSMSDANSSANTGDYLVSTGTAANAAVRMYYNNGSTPIKMQSQFATVTTSVTGNVNLPFTARYFNPVGSSLGTGTVRSHAVLTIEY